MKKNSPSLANSPPPLPSPVRLRPAPQRRSLPFLFGIAAAALPLSAQAAEVTWGPATNITAASDIDSTGLITIAGANFGRTTGTTTMVNNGDVDIEFKSLNSGQSAALANGITVAAASTWENWGVNAGISSVGGTFETVLDYNLGIEGATSATITLSGLTNGTHYQIQFFADSTGSNSQTISGSATMNSLNGQFVVGTFTADDTTQVLTVTRSTDFGVASALTVGAFPSGDATPPTLSGSDIVDDQSGGPVAVNSLVTYTVTFSEDMDASTVAADDFENAGTSAITIGTVTEGPAGVFSVPVTPTSAGTLKLQVKAGAVLADPSANPLDTTTAIADDATLTVDPDTTPPGWIVGWPQADPLSATSLTVRAGSNETGNAYYIVLADGAAAPSSAQVQAGNDSTNSPALKSGILPLTANTEATAPVAGLTTDTTYNVWFVAEDAVPNLQGSPSMVSVSLSSTGGVTWGSVQAITGASDIISTGVTGLAGADFGIAPGTTTVVNNGSVDIEFKSLRSGDSVALSNGITVAAESAWVNWGTNGAISSVGGTFEQVLDRNIGIETPSPTSATITLSGLANGTQYQIQFFADSTGSNTQTISDGSDPMNSLNGQFVTGTFTANGTSQVLTVAWSVEFAVANALTIGVVSGGGNTFADWIGGYEGLNGLTGFNDDADFDGLDNGLENFLGTAPNAGNAGLTAGTLSGNTFTFTHPQNATPASDVSAPAYAWSTDLQTFHANGASAGGITVDLVAATNTPSAGTTTVTATVTGTVPSELFVRLGVSQE